MVSSNKADFNLRESHTLPCNILHNWGLTPLIDTWQRMSLTQRQMWRETTKVRETSVLTTKAPIDYLTYSIGIRDSAESGLGYRDNRHLNHLVESIHVNVGGSPLNVKVSSLPMSVESVGAVIVVRDRESLSHGEGPQPVGIPMQTNQMLTGRNLSLEFYQRSSQSGERSEMLSGCLSHLIHPSR